MTTTTRTRHDDDGNANACIRLSFACSASPSLPTTLYAMSTAKQGTTLDQVSPFHIFLFSAGTLALYAPLAGAIARRYGKVSPEPELAALGSHPTLWGTLKRTWASQGVRGVYRGESAVMTFADDKAPPSSLSAGSKSSPSPLPPRTPPGPRHKRTQRQTTTS